ncbi:FAD-binding oxidoreductase [Acidobacteria bacterium AB60]|nr:FAD-binding oxidoreductase [Acidobacteria bacterium AB60]
MGLSTRRDFVRQAAMAALCCGGAVRGGSEAWMRSGEHGPRASIDADALRKLSGKVQGRVITQEAPDYDAARTIFNKAFDLRPGVIVRCASSSDVQRALEFAETASLELSVRAGGHSRLGYGMCDGGVALDFSAMRRVDVDAGKRTGRAQAGSLVRDLDEATARYGLATTSGGCPTVGVAGFTLGGGEGRLMNKYGAACDNLRSAEVVTVDGRVVVASEESNPDLFWAIRGGGGNFGVVTALEYRVHPVGEVLSGALVYESDRLPELLQAFARFVESASDEMNAFAQIVPSRERARLQIDVCHCGEPGEGRELIAPLRTLKPQSDSVRVMSYLEAQAAGGFLLKPVAHYQTNLFLRDLGGSAISALATAVQHAPAGCKLILVPLGGAVSRVKVSEMAFALRQPGFEIDIAGVWNSPEEKADVVRWVESTRDRLRPLAQGAYVNQLGDTSDQLVRLCYGENYARLVELKKRYDPKNVLRRNQNIKPA